MRTARFKDRFTGATHKVKKEAAKLAQDAGKGLVRLGQDVKKEGDLLAENAKQDIDGARDIEKGNAHLDKAEKHYARAAQKQSCSWFSCRPCCPEESDSEDEPFLSTRKTSN